MSKTAKPSIPSWAVIATIVAVVALTGFFGYRAINGPSAVDVNSVPDSVKYKNPYLGTPGTPGAGAASNTSGGAPSGSAVDLRQQRGGAGATPSGR